MAGFAKKVILADTFGACLAGIPLSGIDQATALGTLVLYMLQIYFDFSGYSDIAIGISELFGFEFNVNFNFPYRSTSISEFWRRWHISLGAWFREYVYFPLGGSRSGKRKTLVNLAVVFALTGFWHGASWNYILWGAVNGGFVILERILQEKKFYRKTPNWLKYMVTMCIVLLCWQLFRFQDIGAAAESFRLTAFPTPGAIISTRRLLSWRSSARWVPRCSAPRAYWPHTINLPPAKPAALCRRYACC